MNQDKKIRNWNRISLLILVLLIALQGLLLYQVWSLPDAVPSFRYWLFRVCKNIWIDHCRKAQFTTGPEALDFIPDPNTPETIYLQNERKQALWAALNTLSPKDREIITLHYFSGLPLNEIAPLVGKSHDAIRQRMVRLRQKLREELEAQGYGR